MVHVPAYVAYRGAGSGTGVLKGPALRSVAFRLAAALLPRIPEALAVALALLAAHLAYVLLASARHAVAANLRPVLGAAATEADVRRAARGVFRTAALNYLDLFRLRALARTAVLARTSMRHAERLHAAVAAGRGVIVVTAHVGPFDAVAQLALVLGLRLTVPVEPIEPPALRDLVTRLRASHGVRYAPLGVATLREIVRALRRGELVALALDRDVLGGGRPLPFFGRTATFHEGPAVLAARTGAAILPVFAVREGLRRASVVIGEPVALVRDERGQPDVAATLRAVVGVLERFIAAHPDQWLVFAPVWRAP